MKKKLDLQNKKRNSVLNEKKRLKILQISTPVLPLGSTMKYGGIERVVRNLDCEYVSQGYEASVIAPEGSVVSGKLLTTLKETSWKDEKSKGEYKFNNKGIQNDFEEHCRMCLDIILKEKPDAIHDHAKFVTSEAYAKSSLGIPILSTIHGIMDDSTRNTFTKIKQDKPVYLNTISISQKNLFGSIFPIDFMVYNALKIEDYPFEEKKRNYLFSMGQIHERKGQDVCIRVAKELGEKVVISGPVLLFRDYVKKFWEEKVEPSIDNVYKDIPAEGVKDFVDYFENSKEKVIYVGELNDAQKKEWFKYSKGFLMPIKFDEPFGLVMIEAMACGTPVVAYNRGAVSEILDDKTGYIAKKDDFEDFIQGVKKLDKINSYNCRERVSKKFNLKEQAKNYVNVFKKIIYLQ